MDKLIVTCSWPELKQVYLYCTLQTIQLNKNGAKWLNCKFVRLELNNTNQLIIHQVDGRSSFAFRLNTTLTIKNPNVLAKLLPKRIKNKQIKQCKIYGHREITTTDQHVLIFDLDCLSSH